MAGTAFNEPLFESRLINLKDSQESINSLSSWCLQNKDHHKKIVTCWLHCLKRVKIDQRLSLFYLANDVIQYSKRKHYHFVESWGTALQKATTLVRDEKVKEKIMRIFKIWEERGVYDEAFISDLSGLLATNIRKKTEANNDGEFQASFLVSKIRGCKKLEDETDLRFRKVKENQLPLMDTDGLRTSLKDRRQGSDIFAEVDQGVKKMEGYVKSLEMEIVEREKLIDMLHQAALFYETQRGEAKIVCNAYRNFSNKVKTLKRKLDELIPTLVESPLPSPDVNAPSPSPDSPELQLPGHVDVYHGVPDPNAVDFNMMSSSFMGNPQFFDNIQRDMFGTNSHPEVGPRAIEVIGSTRDLKQENDFNISDFIKSLMPGGKPEPPSDAEPLKPPPLPPLVDAWKQPTWDVTAGWPAPPPPTTQPQEVQPWETDSWPADTPESPPMYEKEAVGQPIEYDDSIPAPPVPDVDHRTLMPLMQTPTVMDHRGAGPGDVDHRGPPPKLGKLGKDIDHRNLISLTGSPKPGENPAVTKPLQPPPEFVWPGDQDYRPKPPPDLDFRMPKRPNEFNPLLPPPGPPRTEERKDIVESIDMDVSEDDEEQLEDRLFSSMDSSFLDSSDFLAATSGDVDHRLESMFQGGVKDEVQSKDMNKPANGVAESPSNGPARQPPLQWNNDRQQQGQSLFRGRGGGDMRPRWGSPRGPPPGPPQQQYPFHGPPQRHMRGRGGFRPMRPRGAPRFAFRGPPIGRA